MPKLTATAKPAAAAKPALAALAKKSAGNGALRLSHTREHRQKLMLLYGRVGAGKTTCAASASAFCPAALPAAKMTTLSDMLWISVDIDGLASFAHMGLSVPEVDLIEIMSDEEVWSGLGFSRPPSIAEAMSAAVKIVQERVAAGETKVVVVDTLSTFDTRLSVLAKEVTKNDANKYAAYQYMLGVHTKTHDGLTKTGADVIYLAHSRAISDETAAEKAKNAMVLIVGGAAEAPELTGAAPKVYKRDTSLELFVRAYKDKQAKKKRRSVITDVNDFGVETKSRYEGILLPEEEPNLRAIFAKIDAARKGK